MICLLCLAWILRSVENALPKVPESVAKLAGERVLVTLTWPSSSLGWAAALGFAALALAVAAIIVAALVSFARSSREEW